MPDWDDEYVEPYLATGHIGPLDPNRSGKKRRKVNIGFQVPGNEFPPKPKPKPKPRKPAAAKRRKR